MENENMNIIGAGQDTVRPAPKKYKTIVADPPWDIGSFAHTGRKGHKIKPMSNNYKTMSISEIANLDVKNISQKDSFLFLWTTHTYLRKAFYVMEQWGFKYHLTLTWDKGRGLTHFGFHRKSEFVLFGYNGKLNIDARGKSIPTLFYEYNKGHSIKPDIFYSEIEKKFPEPRIDLFARKRRKGWDAWGNEIEESPVLGEESPAQDTKEICHTAPNRRNTQNAQGSMDL